MTGQIWGEWLRSFNQSIRQQKRNAVEDVAVIDDYIVIDEDLSVAGELTDEVIIATVQEGSPSSDEDIDDSDEQIKKPSAKDIRQALSTLKKILSCVQQRKDQHWIPSIK